MEKSSIKVKDNKINTIDKDILSILLKDRSTDRNIIWATDDYAFRGENFQSCDEIKIDSITGENSNVIKQRTEKTKEEQADRIKQKAEVFTPSWICNKMNNHCDEEWFGCKYVFNIEDGQNWVVNAEKIVFPEGKTWKDYVNSKRLEITCGEAPYIVSRYDTTSGELIDINKRIGILDRKLRVVTENAKDRTEWLNWTYRAFQSVYGYEFQGDSLLLARINLLNTFCDYLKAVWKKNATKQQLTKIADIVSWNIWQMDGLTGTVPFGNKPVEIEQFNLFAVSTESENSRDVECKIKDWISNQVITFSSIKRG